MPCFPGSWLTEEEVTYLAWIAYTNYEDTAPPSVRGAMPLTQKGGSELLKCFETLDLHSADWQRIIQPSPENKGRKVLCQGAVRASSSLRDTRWHSLGTGQRGEQGRSRATVQGQPRAWTTSQVRGELRPSQDVRLQVRPSIAGPMARAGLWQCWSILQCHCRMLSFSQNKVLNMSTLWVPLLIFPHLWSILSIQKRDRKHQRKNGRKVHAVCYSNGYA